MPPSNLEKLESIFEYLDRSRHLPGFRLEPHVAPFFATSLPRILSKCLHVKLHKKIVPEFPLRKGSIRRSVEQSKKNQSFKVDYVAFTHDGSTAYLVELKTDMASKKRATNQWCYLQEAKSAQFPKLVLGVKALAKASTEKQKYTHLLHALDSSPYSAQDGQIDKIMNLAWGEGPIRKKGWHSAIDVLQFDVSNCESTEVVYIQPDKQADAEFKFIDFESAAETLTEYGNEIDKLFAKYLRCWKEPAGSRTPSES